MKNGSRIILCFVCLALAAGAAPLAPGAEFNLEMPRVLLRRLQLCHHCGAALLVTRVHPGVAVRCPDCGTEQPRLRDAHLINQLYQMCGLCEMPLDSEGREAGDLVECGNCRARQALSPDAIAPPGFHGGKGYIPGFPPGKGDKTMLFLAGDDENDMAPAGLTQVPELGPEDALAFGAPPLPLDAPPSGPYARPVPPAIPTPPKPPPTDWTPAPLVPVTPSEAVVDVPAVTVDMFDSPELPDLPVQRAMAAAPALDPGDRLLARVDGQPITLRNVDAVVLPALRANPETASAEREARLRRTVLDRLIQRELAVLEARRLGVDPDWDAVRRLAGEIAPRLEGTRLDPVVEAEKEAVMRAMRDRVVAAVKVPPESVLRFYEEHKDETVRPGRLAIASLCIFQDRAGRADPRGSDEIAAEVSRALEAGARFDAMREKYDELPAAAGMPPPPAEPSPREFFAEEVLRAAGDLPSGAVFGPVFLAGVTMFGKVMAALPSAPAPFEELEPAIRARLEAEAGDAAFAAWIRGVAENADIEVY